GLGAKGAGTTTGRTDAALEKQETELATAVIDQRVKHAESAVAAAPDDPAARAKLVTAQKELAEFKLNESKRYVESHPKDHAARHGLGTVLMELGQVDAAIAQFQQAQKGPAVRIPALVGLARSFKAKKLYDLAVAQLNIAKCELGAMDDAKKDVIYELG